MFAPVAYVQVRLPELSKINISCKINPEPKFRGFLFAKQFQTPNMVLKGGFRHISAVLTRNKKGDYL